MMTLEKLKELLGSVSLKNAQVRIVGVVLRVQANAEGKGKGEFDVLLEGSTEAPAGLSEGWVHSFDAESHKLYVPVDPERLSEGEFVPLAGSSEQN